MAINLSKGQKIDLTKSSGESLNNFCVGVNWGVIYKETKNFWGATKSVPEDVDLDLSCIMTDAEGDLVDYIYSPAYNAFLERNKLPKGKLFSDDRALQHSGDDRQGDVGGDDGLDNEIITVNLAKLNPKIAKIFFFINIYLNPGQTFDFAQIPYAKIRMYEGTPTKVNTVFANYDVSTDSSFQGKRALILGKLYLRNGAWRFDAIGDATNDAIFLETITTILKSYAK